MPETDTGPSEPVSETTPAGETETSDQTSSYGVETYLQQKGWTTEQVAQAVGQLLDGVEVAPGAWDRPGIKSLTAAALEWVAQDPAREEAARGFVAEMVKPDVLDEKNLAILERARQLRSEIHTEAAREWLSGSDPLLVEGKERMGIAIETARPFEIIVVDGDSGMYDGDGTKQVQWSRALTGSNDVVPPVFVYKATADLPPIMILDRATVDILRDPTHPQYLQAAKAVVHEYGHTQRDIMTAGLVGVGLEERMAILVAGGQAAVYVETMVYTHILNALSDQKFGQRFRDAIAGAASMDEVYDIVVTSAGPQAAVALAGIPTHAQHYELPAYTAAMVLDGETGPAAIYRHLTESVDMAKLVAGLSTLDNVVAKWLMNNASTAGITLQPEVITALIARLGPDDNPDWYRQHYGLAIA